MTQHETPDPAFSLYASCYDEIRVAPHGDRWDVFDGVGGRLVDTVDTAVLEEIEADYDMPVQMIDGSAWTPHS